MKEKYSAVILLGGNSTRMGSPKYQLEYQGKSFVKHIAKQIPLTNIKYSVHQYVEELDHQLQIVDDVDFQIGPIGGIYTALKQASSEFVIIVSCDVPLINQNIFNHLIAQSAITNKTTIATVNKRVMPTVGIYKKDDLGIIKQAIENQDYKLMNLLSKLDLSYCEFTASQAKYLVNINNQEQYKKLMPPPVICISGFKNSGKTTLMVELIKKLRADNKSVCAIKHDGHDFELLNDVDSNNFFNNGADQVLLYSDYKHLTMSYAHIDINQYIKQVSAIDVILIEGLKEDNFRKIVIEDDEIVPANNRILTVNRQSRNQIEMIYKHVLKELNDR